MLETITNKYRVRFNSIYNKKETIIMINKIEELKVSNGWKKRFQLFNSIGGSEAKSIITLTIHNKKYSALSWWDQSSLVCLLWPLIFGGFWYFAKKMWGKGFVLTGLVMLIKSLFIITTCTLHIESMARFYVFGAFAVGIYSYLGAFDYYKFKVCNEKMWPGFGIFKRTPIITLFVILSLLVLVATIWFTTKL